MWREIVRRIDPAKAAEFFEMDEEAAIEAMLAAGDVPGGPTEGITLEHAQGGPGAPARSRDPDIPFADQVETLVAVPAALAAGAARGDGGVHPHRPHRVLQGGGRGSGSSARRCPRTSRPSTTPSTTRRSGRCALLTPHSKWRIHSSYANNAWLAEIHGGRPEVFISPQDAFARGIATGDEIRVFNTRGEVVAWAHVTPAEQPGSATLYEGWWPRQFRSGKGVNELTSSAVNPIHEVHFVGNMWAPSTGWKDCRCEIEKAGEA